MLTPQRLKQYKTMSYLLVFVGLVSFFMFFRETKKVYTDKEKPSKHFLPNLNIEKIDSINIGGGRDVSSATLKKDNGIWEIVREGDFSGRTAKQNRIHNFLVALRDAKVIDKITAKQSLFKKFQLNRGDGSEITLNSKGKEVSHFILGANNTIAKTAIARKWKEKWVLKIDKAPIVHLFNTSDWVEKKIFNVNRENITDIELAFGKSLIHFRLSDGPKSSNSRWKTDNDKSVLPRKINTLLVRISDLSTARMPQEEELRKANFQNSPLTVRVTTKTGEIIKVTFGNQTKDNYLVRREIGKNIFLVDKRQFKPFTYPIERYL